MADKITRLPTRIERIAKEEEKYSWFIHKCVNVEFFLRGDGALVCTKCRKVIGTYELNADEEKN